MSTGVFDLGHQADKLAALAADAMKANPHGYADSTSAGKAQAILAEAQRLLPEDKILQAVVLESAPMWVSVRSAMDAASESCFAGNRKAAVAVVPGGPQGWMSR